jgi:hypothetical protein
VEATTTSHPPAPFQLARITKKSITLLLRSAFSVIPPLYALCEKSFYSDAFKSCVLHSQLIKFLIRNSQASQAKVLTGGGDLRGAQVDVPLSISHSCV